MKTHVGGALTLAVAASTGLCVNAFTTPRFGIKTFRSGMPRPATSRLAMSTPTPRVYIPLELEGELDSEKEWEIEMELDGEVKTLKVKEGTSVLNAAKSVYNDPPHSCQQGVCTTCAGLIRSGELGVDYKVAVDALSDSQKAEGFTLTCQTYPCGPGLKVLLNQYDRVYEEQYGKYEFKDQNQGLLGSFFKK